MGNPKARMCSCQYEKVRLGSKVYIKGHGILTTNFSEVNQEYPWVVGDIVEGPTLKLNEYAEEALSYL